MERELDLVEVAPHAQPPVCRLMDYGRYKFEEIKKEKDSRRSHNVIHVKEVKLRPKISEHDFRTKFGYVKHFLEEGDKVKLTIMFRGREMVHQEYGRRLLDRMAEELKELATIERSPLVEGRNMIMILNPVAKKAAPGKPEAGVKANGEEPPAAAPEPTNGTPAADAAPAPEPKPKPKPAPAPEPHAEPSAEKAEKAEPVAAAAKATPSKPTTRRPSATRSTTGDAKDSNP